MGERNRFAFDRDYYNRIAAEYINGSSAKRVAASEEEMDIDEYLTATYAPEYRDMVKSSRKEKSAKAERPVRVSQSRSAEVHSSRSNAVRKTAAASVQEPARTPEVPGRQTESSPRIKTRYLIRLNYFKIIIVSALIVLVVQSALNLLSVKSDVNRIDKEISNAKITLEDVNSYNESLLGKLDISYDRNYIYNVAVGKLGMVYPKDNAVVYYKAADTSHVIQYRDIP